MTNGFDGFEWDRKKSARTEQLRGFDFHFATRVFEDEHRIELDDERQDWGEPRTMSIGLVDGYGLLVVVWTPRGRKRRIISARKPTQRERVAYGRFRGSRRRGHLE